MTSTALVIGLAGALLAIGIYLLLQRNLLRALLGLVVLSNGVNLLLLSLGELGSTVPPLVAEGAQGPAGDTANPLPQALVLTAIVIGFGLVSFALALARRAYQRLGSADGDELSPVSQTARSEQTR